MIGFLGIFSIVEGYLKIPAHTKSSKNERNKRKDGSYSRVCRRMIAIYNAKESSMY